MLCNTEQIIIKRKLILKMLMLNIFIVEVICTVCECEFILYNVEKLGFYKNVFDIIKFQSCILYSLWAKLPFKH